MWLITINLGMIMAGYIPSSYGFLTDVVPAVVQKENKVLINSLFLTVIPIGIAIGGVLGGTFMAKGRRCGMFLANGLILIGIAVSIMTDILSLMLLGRFITSISCGTLGAVCSKFTMEILPLQVSSKFGFLPGMFCTIGAALA